MGKRAAGLAAVLVIGALGLVATSDAGPGDDSPPVIVSLDVRPELVALNRSNQVEVVLEAHVIDDVGVTAAEGFLVGPSFYGIPTEKNVVLSLQKGDETDGIWRGALVFTSRSSAAGKWTSEACFGDVSNPNYCQDDGPRDVFFVKRSTVIRAFNVREPVASGSRLRMRGRLVRLRPNGTFVGFGSRKVFVYFKPLGSATWRLKGSVETSRRGWFASRRFKARRNGAWRAVFKPTTTYLGDRSGADYVAVRG